MENNKKSKSRKITLLGVFTSITIIISIIENYMPPLISFFPYAKLGLSNICTLFILIAFNVQYASVVVLLKCLIVSLLSGNITSLFYSLPSGIISLLFSYILLNYIKINIIPISVFSAIAHNLTQLTVAILITKTFSIIVYMPHLLLIAVITGSFVGFSCYALLKSLNKYLFYGHFL